MIYLERITADNLETAVAVQEELFPLESGRLNFEESLSGGSSFSYFLINEADECVGVIGIYSYPEDRESGWLGWFGIREPYRRHHYGTQAMKRFEQIAADLGFRYVRLYTDRDDNDAAISFYQANGYTSEPYCCREDPASLAYPMLIFSKSLSSDPVPPWNSRNIHLSEQIAKQEEGQKRK